MGVAVFEGAVVSEAGGAAAGVGAGVATGPLGCDVRVGPSVLSGAGFFSAAGLGLGVSNESGLSGVCVGAMAGAAVRAKSAAALIPTSFKVRSAGPIEGTADPLMVTAINWARPVRIMGLFASAGTTKRSPLAISFSRRTLSAAS